MAKQMSIYLKFKNPVSTNRIVEALDGTHMKGEDMLTDAFGINKVNMGKKESVAFAYETLTSLEEAGLKVSNYTIRWSKECADE